MLAESPAKLGSKIRVKQEKVPPNSHRVNGNLLENRNKKSNFQLEMIPKQVKETQLRNSYEE